MTDPRLTRATCSLRDGIAPRVLTPTLQTPSLRTATLRAHQVIPPRADTVPSAASPLARHRAAASVLLVSVMLAGCGGGDAERVRQLEATQAAMVKQMQAMDSARRESDRRAAQAAQDSARLAAERQEQAKLATTEVFQRINAIVADLRGRSYPDGIYGMRAKLADTHVEFAKVDVSSCPAEFRAQYQRVVTAARLFSEASQDIPADGLEAFIRGMEQSNSPDPDFSGNRAALMLRERFEGLTREVNELAALARSYGVT